MTVDADADELKWCALWYTQWEITVALLSNLSNPVIILINSANLRNYLICDTKIAALCVHNLSII